MNQETCAAKLRIHEIMNCEEAKLRPAAALAIAVYDPAELDSVAAQRLLARLPVERTDVGHPQTCVTTTHLDDKRSGFDRAMSRNNPEVGVSLGREAN